MLKFNQSAALALMIAVVAGSTASFAQTRKTTRMDQDVVIVEPKNNVSIDAAPMLENGVGASYERVIQPKLTFGLMGSTFRMAGGEDLETEHTIQSFGLRSRYFFTGHAYESGFYGSLAGVFTNVKTSITMKAPLGNRVPGAAQESAAGFQAGLGYQFLATNLSDTTKLVFNLGALYGNGYEIGTTAQVRAFEREAQTQVKINYGLFLEASIGLLF